jgi:hypothetical protein
VISDFDFSELGMLASDSPSVQKILRLSVFKPKSKGSTIHSQFLQEAIHLNREIAAGMGAITNLFGLGYATTDEQMSNFVDNLVDGFALDAPTNSTVMDDLGTVFVESLSNYSTHRRCMSEVDKDVLKDYFLAAVAQSSAAIKRKRNSKGGQLVKDDKISLNA